MYITFIGVSALEDKMIVERKEFHCKVCGGIKIIEKNEPNPKVCPFCGRDEFGKVHWNKAWTKQAETQTEP